MLNLLIVVLQFFCSVARGPPPSSTLSALSANARDLDSAKSRRGFECPCNDAPPQAAAGQKQFTCEEQKVFGKCNEDFMVGFCECTCGRCCPCNNSPPPGSAFTCKQQRLFGKCDDDFMAGFCECECGRCVKQGESFRVTECQDGMVPKFHGAGCESVRCAEERLQCADICGGLTEAGIYCKDKPDTFFSGDFFTSCWCAK